MLTVGQGSQVVGCQLHSLHIVDYSQPVKCWNGYFLAVAQVQVLLPLARHPKPRRSLRNLP